MNNKNNNINILIRKLNITVKKDNKKVIMKKLENNDFKFLIWKNNNYINNGK